MTYAEWQLLAAYLDALPLLASREFAGGLKLAGAWMTVCLSNDAIAARFAARMNAVMAEADEWRREKKPC